MNRRLRFAPLGLALVLAAGSARGDVGDELVEAAVRAAADMALRVTLDAFGHSIAAPSGERSPLPELADWKDPATDSTSRMTAGCGVLVESTLTGSSGRNFINVVVVNETPKPLELTPFLVGFSSGARSLLSAMPLRVSGAARAATSIAFPSKHDFADQRWLKVVFAVDRPGQRSCWLTVHHERTSGVESDPESYLAYSKAEVWFGAGLRFDASGGLRTFDRGDGLAIELGTTMYLAAHHGLSVELLSEGDGSSFGYAAGYTARVYPLSWLSLTYGPAVGAATYVFGDGTARDETWAMVFQQRLRLQARLFRHPDMGVIHLAPSLVYQIVANGEVGGVGLRGSTTAVFLSLGVGL